MRATPFDFHAPTELEQVLALLHRHGEDAKVLAGGMSLVPMMTLGLARPAVLVSLNHTSGLDYVRDAEGTLRLGAMVRHETLRTHELVRQHCPMLADAASHVGDVQVRHRGTVGGSVAHADPAADYLPVLYALDATVTVANAAGRRQLKVRDLLVDSLRTVLEPTDLVVEVEIPKVRPGFGWAYERLGRVEGNFAIVNVAALVNGGNAVAAIGAATASPVIVETSAGTRDDMVTSIGAAAFDACANAYSDLSGDATYRRAMAKVHTQRAVEAALDRRAA